MAQVLSLKEFTFYSGVNGRTGETNQINTLQVVISRIINKSRGYRVMRWLQIYRDDQESPLSRGTLRRDVKKV